MGSARKLKLGETGGKGKSQSTGDRSVFACGPNVDVI